MNKKIIIIGSGASGLAAATKLIEFGYKNITILESENRIGGRIYTIEFGANVLDLGAQWCHGEKNNVVYEIAKKYKNDIFCSTGDIYQNFTSVKSNKEVVSQNTVLKLKKIIYECLESDQSKKELNSFEGSLEEFLNKKFHDTLRKPENVSLDEKTAKQFLEFYKKFKCSLDGCDTLADLTGSGEAAYWECDGDSVLNWKGQGYITVLKILMNATGDKPYGILENKILLNKKVEEVCWQQNGNKEIYVRCSDGDIIFADHIICTVSLGVLKEKHSAIFNPSLPAFKIRAIEGLGIGNVDKLFLEFSQPFWPENWSGMCLLWEEDDLKIIREREDNWIEDVFGFYPVDFQPNILCGWIVGKKGRQMENASDEEVLNGLVFLLKKFSKWVIPKPKNFVRSTWYKNPNFRGSYSFRSVKAEKLNTNAAELAFPLVNNYNTPVLQFAGEATHNHYFSTVHGAIESGWREAIRLNDFYNNCDLNNIQLTCTNNITNKKKNAQNDDNNFITTYDNNKNIYDVIILGAGLAGLGAGYCLKQYQQRKTNISEQKKNLNFVILEAQDYIGGRIRTVQMKQNQSLPLNHNDDDDHIEKSLSNLCFKNYVDSGAQWLHGKQNKLYKIADDYNLLRPELSEEGLGLYISDDGEIINDYFHKKIDFKIGQILEECENFTHTSYDEKIKNKNIYPKSVEEYLNNKFDEYLKQEKQQKEFNSDPKKYEDALKLLDWHKRFQIIDNSCLSLNQVSAKFWGLYTLDGESCQAHINFNESGFSTIIDDALVKIIGKCNIRMKTEVCSINWDILHQSNKINSDNTEYNVCNTHSIQNNLICIETSDKRLFYAKHIIITFSLGVLKLNEHKMFIPKLPKFICNAINCMGFETINKIFLQFERPWWQPMEGIQLLFSDNNYKNAKWTRYLSGFDVLYPGPPNTLVGWVGSYGAIEMEKFSDEKIIQDCISLLTQFTKRDVPLPINYYCSRWNSNKFVRGAYSFLSTKCDELNITGKTFTKPVTLADLKSIVKIEDDKNLKHITLSDHGNSSSKNNETYYDETDNCFQFRDYPLILFAGEACHDTFFSTAHGAFESGYEQAEKLINYYSSHQK